MRMTMMEAGTASILLSNFFFLSPLKAGQSHLTILLPFSPLTATERSENPNAIAMPLKGGVGEKSGAATIALNHR